MSDGFVRVPNITDEGVAVDNAVLSRNGQAIYRQRVEVYSPADFSSMRVEDYKIAIARGQIPGAGFFRVIGRNPDVDDVREDMWENGGNYVFPPAGGIQMRLVSTSAEDAAAGNGARTMDLHYLDANGVQREEVVTLNGLTPVLTVATNIWRINEFHTKTAGSTGYVAGSISVTDVANTITYSVINAAGNRARQAIWTVPAGKIAFVNEAWIGGNAEGGNLSNFAEGYLRATCDISGEELLPGMFNFKWGAIVASATIGGEMESPVALPALCDVKISVQSRAANSNVRAIGGFSGWYENAA